MTSKSDSIAFNHMIERSLYLDGLFESLSDAVRRDILARLVHALHDASQYLAQFEALWNYRFAALDEVLKEDVGTKPW